MRLVKAVPVLTLAALVLSGSASAQSPRETAAKLLVRSMQREFPVNVISIITQRDPKADASFQRVKVERSKSGQQRCTILQPLRLQGVVSVDDGERMKIYLPDKKVMLDQESPGKAEDGFEERLELVKKNYSCTMSNGGKIAGRRAILVTATPKVDELEVRRYYLDEATTYPLRLETYLNGKEITVVFDTKDIQFPATLESGLFTLTPIGKVRTIQYNRPTRIGSSTQAKSLVGFVPLVPKTLPLGFAVQEVQYSESTDAKAIVVRLSDGLARASVYQTKSGDKLSSDEDSTVFEYKGVRLMLVSDMTPEMREQLLRAFITQSVTDGGDTRAQRFYGSISPLESGLQAITELVGGGWTLAGIEAQSPETTLPGT